MAAPTDEQQDLLTAAYERRNTQLYETRGALAEAVSALTVELAERREENSGLHEHADNLAAEAEKQRNHALTFAAELEELRKRVTAIDAELRTAHDQVAALRNMKVVRWTAWPRSVIYRLRARGG